MSLLLLSHSHSTVYVMNLNNGTWGQLHRGTKCATRDNWRWVCGNKAPGHLTEGNISTPTYLEKGSLPDQRKVIHLVGFHGQKCKLGLNKSDPNHGTHLSFTAWKKEGLRVKPANPPFWIRQCWRICSRRQCCVSEGGWVTWLFFEVFHFCQNYIIWMFVTPLTKTGKGQAWMTGFHFGILQWVDCFCQVVPSLGERTCYGLVFCPSKKTLFSETLKLY